MLKSLIQEQKAALVMGAVALASLAIVGIESPRALIVLVGGLACVALLVGAYLLLQRARKRRKDRKIDDTIRMSSKQPAGGAERQAELESLQRKFESGIETLESLGLSMNALPWIAIVGEPASGKSEAIRRCKIPFPQGLTDELQGTGGTVNMDWWFTEHAIILDTAGKMLFEEIGQAESSEWVRFLELIRKVRPRCPINGMLLVIPADSLLADSDEKIEDNARKIARQLTQIQRKLSVRFPVYVVVTKSDLIAGFREFFGALDDRLHQQMLGWSSPDPLDEPFDPDKLDRALADIRDRLEHHRFELLRDPVHTEDPAGSRLGQVDRLYDFPSAVEATGPRLRRYLEIVFAGGKLAPKSLFFRGIYFTSSIQKGSALDAILAESLGLSVEQIKEAAPFERVRPLFLRDLFMDKVFEETGLITHVDNTDKLKSRRRTVLLGAGAGLVALFFALAGVQYLGFRSAMGDPRDAWRDVATRLQSGEEQQLIQSFAGATSYHAGVDALASVGALAQRPITVPITLRIASGFQADLREQQMQAYRSLVVWAAVTPAVEAARRAIDDDDIPLERRAAAAAQILRLHTLARGQTPAGDRSGATDAAATPTTPTTPTTGLVDLDPLYRLALPDDHYETFQADRDRLAALLRDAFGPGSAHLERSARLALGAARPGTDAFAEEPVAIAARFAGATGPVHDLSTIYGCVATLDESLADFARADTGLRKAHPAEDSDEARAARAHEGAFVDTIIAAEQRIDDALGALASLGVSPDTLVSADDLAAAGDRDYRSRRSLLLDQLPAPAAATGGPAPKLAEARALLDNSLPEDPPTDFASLRAPGDGAEDGSAAWYLQFIGAAGDARFYSAISRMYARAGAVAAAAYPPPETVTIDTFLAQVLQRGRRADGAIEIISQTRRDHPGAPPLGPPAAAAERMARRAAAALPTEVVIAAMARVDAERAQAAIERAVAEFARAQREEPELFPEIAGAAGFAPGQRHAIDWRFHPDGVGPLARHCWARLIADTSAGGGAGASATTTLRDNFTEARDRLAAALTAFGSAYIAYWAEEVPAMASADFPRTEGQSRWEAVSAALDTLDVSAALAGLDGLRAQMEGAGAALPEPLQDQLQVGFLDREADADAIAGVIASLNYWHDHDSASAARSALIDMRTADWAASAYGGLEATELARLIYWRSLFAQIFQQLAGHLQDEVAEARATIERQFARFPLVRPAPSDTASLTGAQLGEALTWLDRAAPPDLEAEPPATGLGDFDTAIGAIYDPAGESASRYADMRRIASALERGAINLQIFRIDRQRQSPPDALPGRRPAINEWDYIQVTTPGNARPQGANARPESDSALVDRYRLRYQPAPMTLALSAGQRKIERTFEGPWAELRLLLLPGVEPYQSDALDFGSAYRVPLVFTDDAGGEFYYWIGLRLTVDSGQPADLPEPGAWPTPLPPP